MEGAPPVPLTQSLLMDQIEHGLVNICSGMPETNLGTTLII